MGNDFLKKVGLELKLVRVEHGFSIEDIAKKTQMSTATICNYENCKTLLFLDNIVKILNAYDDMTPTIFFNRITTKM